MKLFLFAWFSPIFSDEMLWDMVCGVSCVLCKSISVPVYNVHDVAAQTDVTDDFVDDLFGHISGIRLVCSFSRFCFVRVYVEILVLLVRFFVMTASGSRRRRMCCTVYKVYV